MVLLIIRLFNRILVTVPYSCLSAAFFQEKFRQKRAEMQKFGSRHLLRNDLYTPSDIWWLQTFFKSTLINLTFLTWVGKQTAYHTYAHYQFCHEFTSFLSSGRLCKYRWLIPKYVDKVISFDPCFDFMPIASSCIFIPRSEQIIFLQLQTLQHDDQNHN